MATAQPAPEQPRATASQRPAPTPARQSLLAQIQANGTDTVLTLAPVRTGTVCATTARLRSGGRLDVSGPSRQVAGADGRLAYDLDGSQLPDNDTVIWEAACSLNGDSRTITFMASTPTSDRPSPPGEPVPAPRASPTPSG